MCFYGASVDQLELIEFMMKERQDFDKIKYPGQKFSEKGGKNKSRMDAMHELSEIKITSNKFSENNLKNDKSGHHKSGYHKSSLKRELDDKIISELKSLDNKQLEEVIRDDKYLNVLRSIDDKNLVVKCFLGMLKSEKNGTTRNWIFNRLKSEVLVGSFKLDQDLELEMYQMEQEFSLVSQLRRTR